MQRFYNFLDHNRNYVTLGLAILFSLVMLLLGSTEKMALVRGVSASLLKTGHWVFSWPMDVSELRFENRVLREQNLRLSLDLMKLQEEKLENIRLRGLLQFKEDNFDAYLTSKVIARDADRIPNTVLIDIGTNDGVDERMPVVTADGLVGRVLEVHSSTAIVQLLQDTNCRVSAIVQQEERTQGIVLCEGGIFYLKNVKVRSKIKKGDRVISSGFGEIFPKGLPIGYVSSLSQEDQGLFLTVILTPSVNFTTLEEVFVLKVEPGVSRKK